MGGLIKDCNQQTMQAKPDCQKYNIGTHVRTCVIIKYMSLEILRLHPTQNWETPYEFDTNGFTEKWWHSINITETIADQQENDYWSFRENDTEIVRVWLEKSHLNDHYEHLTPPETITKVIFFEVREPYRRQGYGTEAVKMLMPHYNNQLIAAFPVNDAADSFWHSVGFVYYPRTDGTDLRCSNVRSIAPLFVYDNR